MKLKLAYIAFIAANSLLLASINNSSVEDLNIKKTALENQYVEIRIIKNGTLTIYSCRKSCNVTNCLNDVCVTAVAHAPGSDCTTALERACAKANKIATKKLITTLQEQQDQ